MKSNKRLVKLLTFFMLFFCMNVWTNNPDEKSSNHFTIMGLGDSITQGGEDAYLCSLNQMLDSAGYSVEFIGPNVRTCNGLPLHHCGFGGKTIEFLEARIDTIYRKYPADVVLLHAGHNHTYTEKPVTGMIAAYKSLICKIREINPDAKIFVAQVIPSGKLPKYSYIPELNREIAKMVRKQNDKNVLLVDLSRDFDWKRYTHEDMVHPNHAGVEKMAGAWYAAIQKYFKN